MDQSNKPLSQAEIDAMLAKAAPAQPSKTSSSAHASHPATASPASSPAQVAPKRTADTPYIESLYKTIDELTQRLARLESAYIERMGQIEKAIADSKANAAESADSRDDSQELKNIRFQLAGIIQNLQATPGYGARNAFKCSQCGSQRLVAITLRCTKCGGNSLWGWLPRS